MPQDESSGLAIVKLKIYGRLRANFAGYVLKECLAPDKEVPEKGELSTNPLFPYIRMDNFFLNDFTHKFLFVFSPGCTTIQFMPSAIGQ